MDIYTLSISIILVLCGWVLFRSRDHVAGPLCQDSCRLSFS